MSQSFPITLSPRQHRAGVTLSPRQHTVPVRTLLTAEPATGRIFNSRFSNRFKKS